DGAASGLTSDTGRSLTWSNGETRSRPRSGAERGDILARLLPAAERDLGHELPIHQDCRPPALAAAGRARAHGPRRGDRSRRAARARRAAPVRTADVGASRAPRADVKRAAVLADRLWRDAHLIRARGPLECDDSAVHARDRAGGAARRAAHTTASRRSAA